MRSATNFQTMKFSIYHFILKYSNRIKYHTAYQHFKSDEKKGQHSQRMKIPSFTDILEQALLRQPSVQLLVGHCAWDIEVSNDIQASLNKKIDF